MSLDAVHTAYLADVRGAEFPSAFVVRNDGSGRCQLTQDVHAETYGVRFSDDARRVFWIEYFRDQSESEEGWYAQPEHLRRPGEVRRLRRLVHRRCGTSSSLFDGGDLETPRAGCSTPRSKPGPGAVATPIVIQERPDGAGQRWSRPRGSSGRCFATGGMDPPALLPARAPAPPRALT